MSTYQSLIILLQKLNKAAPDVCRQDDGVFIIGDYHFWPSPQHGFCARHTQATMGIKGHPALAWLEAALEQVIEARGWEYTLCKFNHNYFIEIWSDEVVFESQAADAAEALLAALIKAMGG